MKLSQIVRALREILSDVGPSQIKLWSPDMRMPQFCWYGSEAKDEKRPKHRTYK